jgi:hypothetical protein
MYLMVCQCEMAWNIVCLCFKLCDVYVLLSVRVLFKLLMYQFKYGVIFVSTEFIHVYPLFMY